MQSCETKTFLNLAMKQDDLAEFYQPFPAKIVGKNNWPKVNKNEPTQNELRMQSKVAENTKAITVYVHLTLKFVNIIKEQFTIDKAT